MTKRPIIILVGFLLMIFLFGKYTTWQLEKWKETLPKGFPKIAPEELPSLPQFFPTSTFPFPFPTSTLFESFPYPQGMPSIPQQGITQPGESKEFISPDGKLRVKFPPNWLKLEIEPLQRTIPKRLAETYQMRVLFLAQKFGGEKSGQLIISQAIIEAKMEIEKLLEEIMEEAKKQGWEIEIFETKIEEGKFIFEALYKKQNFPTLHSKEKMLWLKLKENKRKVFLIELVTTDMDWEYFKKEFEEILNNALIVE